MKCTGHDNVNFFPMPAAAALESVSSTHPPVIRILSRSAFNPAGDIIVSYLKGDVMACLTSNGIQDILPYLKAFANAPAYLDLIC